VEVRPYCTLPDKLADHRRPVAPADTGLVCTLWDLADSRWAQHTVDRTEISRGVLRWSALARAGGTPWRGRLLLLVAGGTLLEVEGTAILQDRAGL
jgi:hypothetical protein